MDDAPQFDLYGTLGVPPSASRAEIDAAYRAGAKRHHPDTSPDAVAGTRQMQRLNIARDWLTDPDRRARYDRARGVVDPRSRPIRIPDIDPLGPWPDAPSARPGTAPSSVMAAIAAVALMILLGTVLIGIGSNILTVAAFAFALLVLVYAGAYVVIGWVR